MIRVFSSKSRCQVNQVLNKDIYKFLNINVFRHSVGAPQNPLGGPDGVRSAQLALLHSQVVRAVRADTRAGNGGVQSL